jgi:hypothetical protein
LQNRFQHLLEPLQYHFAAHFADEDSGAVAAGDGLRSHFWAFLNAPLDPLDSLEDSGNVLGQA